MKSESASTALGTVATICWCIQLIPQIWYNWKRKDCTGLPPIMMFLWVISGIPFGIYFCISAPNIILQIQPHLFTFFCYISFVQTMYYPPARYDRMKIVIISVVILLTGIGLEVGFIIYLRPIYARGETWPDLIFGIIASVLLAVGLLPPYFELYKRKGRVVGINFLFLFIDSLGAWLSIASVCVGTMDTVGIVLYAIIAGMELGLFLSQGFWYLRFRVLQKDHTINDNEEEEEKDGTTAHESGNKEQDIEERKTDSKINFNTETHSLEPLNDYVHHEMHDHHHLINVSKNKSAES